MYSNVGKIITMFRDFNSFNIINETDRDTLVDLEFISRIRVGQKVNVRHRFLQNDGIVTAFSRTFWNIDNKDNTLSFCDITVRRTFNILKLLEAELSKYQINTNDYNKTMSNIRSVIRLLCKSIQGMVNLQTTYAGHDRFISHISQLINEINVEMEQRLNIYFPEGDYNKSPELTHSSSPIVEEEIKI